MRNWLAVGLMSGTSVDGVDAALIETDGGAHIRPIAFHYAPYLPELRAMIRAAMAEARPMAQPGTTPLIAEAERRITDAHGAAVEALLAQSGHAPEVVGFHGQTIVHRPDLGWTWQIGDGARLAAQLGVTVVHDFRRADMEAGGQGAPLLPVFHRALLSKVEHEGGRMAVLNLGGVANLTWLGEHLGEWLSFDTGPANALIDDWIGQMNGTRFDDGGALAAAGRVDEAIVAAMLQHPYFVQPAPKSLDRDVWNTTPVARLSAADGAATLTAFTAAAVARALALCPSRPAQLLATGGGRLNATLMRMVAERTGVPTHAVEAVGWNGDALEAEAFAYFAVRRLTGRPITFPETTGCATPTIGGVVNAPAFEAARWTARG